MPKAKTIPPSAQARERRNFTLSEADMDALHELSTLIEPGITISLSKAISVAARGELKRRKEIAKKSGSPS